MRTPFLLLIPVLAFAMSGCSRYSCYDSCPEDVVSETYVHKYGVEVAPDDWSERGQSGQVVSTRKDGTTEVRCYEGGSLHGDSTYSFPHSSTVACREKYEQGNLSAKIFYYRSGFAEREEAPLDNGRRKVTIWYESGEPQSIEEYEGNYVAVGLYYTPENVVEARVDEGDGERVARDSHGLLISRERIKEGAPVEIVYFHPNGTPKEVVPLRNGLKNGTVLVYLQDGEPARREVWNNGVMQGITTLFENGEMVARVPYVNGEIQGVEERYRDGSTLAARITWAGGMRHGPTYHYSGDRSATDWYYYDRPVSQNDFDLLSNAAQKSKIMN